MPHVDEGTLHALLDGELASAEAAEVRVHFATCPSCAARLDEARQLLAETERLVSALELPRAAARIEPRQAAAGRSADLRPVATGAVAGTLRPPAPGTPLPPLDPVVLIPENPTIREVRRSRLRIMGWAAGFLVVIGAGFFGVTSFQQAPRNTDGRLTLSPDEFTTAPPRAEREGGNADSAPTLGLSDSQAPALEPESRAAAGKPTAAPATPAPATAASETATPRTPPATSEAKTAPPSAANRLEPVAAAPPPPAPTATPAAPTPRRDAADQPANVVQEKAKLGKAADATLRDNEASSPESPRDQAVATPSASEATLELDRRRTRERAAEATAALDRQIAGRRAAEERERQLAERAAAAAPAPAARPAVDERTGLSSRIGLDEAARQLGGPLHAIDGLTRQSVGLVAGASVEGADPDRPVVRAVYADRSSGTMLFLDQQMARPGAGPATPQTGPGGRQIWVKDGVLLVLHGDVGTDSLRSLARRVR
jgi:hypothetical protein